MKKILLIGPYGLGNTILAYPAMKILRETMPSSEIDVLCLLPSVHKLVSLFPDFDILDNIYVLDLQKKLETIKTIINIQKRHYDYSIVLFPSASIHYNIINFLSLAKKRVGSIYPDVNFARGYFLNNVQVPVEIGIHDSLQNVKLVMSGMNIQNFTFSGRKFFSKLAKKNKKKIVGIHPGCKRGFEFRRWDIKKYMEIIRKILNNTNYTVKIFFGPDESEYYTTFYEEFGKQDGLDYIFDASLEQVIEEINECKIFLSNDSGLMHIANFLGAHNIVIIGPSDYRRSASPTNPPFDLIYDKTLKCLPCSHTYEVKSHKFKCIYNDIRCLRNLSVQKVWSILKQRLI